jgi:hypothetical protein
LGFSNIALERALKSVSLSVSVGALTEKGKIMSIDVVALSEKFTKLKTQKRIQNIAQMGLCCRLSPNR